MQTKKLLLTAKTVIKFSHGNHVVIVILVNIRLQLLFLFRCKLNFVQFIRGRVSSLMLGMEWNCVEM